MQLTDHMRKHLLDGVISAQKTDNPLLEGINLQRLQHTLERDITQEELSSIMLLIGSNREESMRAMCLTVIDRQTSKPVDELVPPEPRGWRVEPEARWGRLKRLTHRTQQAG